MSEKTVIIFDLDGTIVSKNTQTSLFIYLFKKKKISLKFFSQVIFWSILYKLGIINLSKIMGKIYRFTSKLDPDNFESLLTEFYRDIIRKQIYRRALQLIEKYESSGMPVGLISTSIQPLVKIVGDQLKVNFAIGTKLQVENGKFTGKIAGKPMYGIVKLETMRKLAQENGWDLASSYFFSDNHSDKPSLEAVGHPRAINPTPKLRKMARRNHWLILYW